MIRNLFCLSAVALLAMICGGCLISSNTTVIHTGAVVPDATFSQIKPGETTEAWVRATIGQPTSEAALDNGGKILKWAYTERRESDGAVFLVFRGHDEKDVTHTAYVQVATGVVTKAWRD
jgi:outer membrane protein assembly factor BamE (lipoprotein component of BamABCDE complex)